METLHVGVRSSSSETNAASASESVTLISSSSSSLSSSSSCSPFLLLHHSGASRSQYIFSVCHLFSNLPPRVSFLPLPAFFLPLL